MTRQERREAIAALEHEQWLDWIAGVIDHLPDERQRPLRRHLLVAYEDLPVMVKELDRYYADKVIAVMDPLVTELAAALEDLAEGAHFAKSDATSKMVARARAVLKEVRQ